MSEGKNARDTQFHNFANALYMECCNIYQEEMLKGPLRGIDQLVILNIARRAYDLVAHTIGYSLEYLHECGREMPGGMKTRIVPSIPDLTELPKEQAMYFVDSGDSQGSQSLETLKLPDDSKAALELSQSIMTLIEECYDATEEMGSIRTFHGLRGLINDIEHICNQCIKKAKEL